MDHSVFYRLEALLATQPRASKHWNTSDHINVGKKDCHFMLTAMDAVSVILQTSAKGNISVKAN